MAMIRIVESVHDEATARTAASDLHNLIAELEGEKARAERLGHIATAELKEIVAGRGKTSKTVDDAALRRALSYEEFDKAWGKYVHASMALDAALRVLARM